MSNRVFQFESLQHFPELVHGISRRYNKAGQSWNMSFDFESPKQVLAHRSGLQKALRISSEVLVEANQTHGDRIFSFRNGEPLPEKCIKNVDAFLSDSHGIYFMIKTADCQSIFLYDPVKRVFGVVHSGWRGSLQNIVGQSVQKMVDDFGGVASDIRAAVGPSLGPCCAAFTDPDRELSEKALPYLSEGNRVDFWSMTRAQLEQEGVLSKHIEIVKICTACHTQDWFSHRGDKEKPGRMGSVIGLRVA